jgi:hypothetical protein
MDTIMVAESSTSAQVMYLSVEDVKGLRVMYPDLFIQLAGQIELA